MVKLLCGFIRTYMTENDALKDHLNHNLESDSTNRTSFHPNAATHHIQNYDQFDEEDDS